MGSILKFCTNKIILPVFKFGTLSGSIYLAFSYGFDRNAEETIKGATRLHIDVCETVSNMMNLPLMEKLKPKINETSPCLLVQGQNIVEGNWNNSLTKICNNLELLPDYTKLYKEKLIMFAKNLNI